MYMECIQNLNVYRIYVITTRLVKIFTKIMIENGMVLKSDA